MVHQGVAQSVHFTHDGVKGPFLVLVDEEGLVDAPSRVEELAQVLGRVLEFSVGDTVTLDIDDLEGLTRRRDHRHRLIHTECHSFP